MIRRDIWWQNAYSLQRFFSFHVHFPGVFTMHMHTILEQRMRNFKQQVTATSDCSFSKHIFRVVSSINHMVQCMSPDLENHLTVKTPKYTIKFLFFFLFLLEKSHLLSVHFLSTLEDADEGPKLETWSLLFTLNILSLPSCK